MGSRMNRIILAVSGAHLALLVAVMLASQYAKVADPKVIQIRWQSASSAPPAPSLSRPTASAPSAPTVTPSVPSASSTLSAPAVTKPSSPAIPAPEAPPAPSSSPGSPASAPDATSREPTIDASFKGNPLPVYPSVSRRLGEEGVVVLRVLIGTDGRAAEVRISKSSGSARLDQAAIEAIGQWRFIAATRAGRPVAAWYEWRWEFRLNN